MIRQDSERGSIIVESNVYRNIAGLAASNCFGVKGMAARSRTDGLIYLLRKESANKGVSVTFDDDDSVTIDLHIMVDHGVNIPVISASIISEVRYNVTKSTGTAVKAINVHVDSIMLD
ncbi:MAG: Asp23/Gls24 family envelope stress response protein [Oscillospiraceae bacterium]|nr:Asp23/Gls24 family envelope stress response protein [Oscillospiraceae bacterium]